MPDVILRADINQFLRGSTNAESLAAIGAASVDSLASKADKNFLTVDQFSAESLPSAFPDGTSYMPIENAADWGLSSGGGVLVTHRQEDGRHGFISAIQIVHNPEEGEWAERVGKFTATGGWTDWVFPLETADLPEELAELPAALAAETAARIAAIEALQQIPTVLVASGNEFRPDTDFGKLLSIDGSTSYLYLPGGSANDVGKRLWVTSANASFLYDYSDIEYYGQTTPGVLYMAVATSFASGSLRWKVSLDQTSVNLTGIQTIGGTKTFSSPPRSSGALSGNANEIPNISQIYAMLVDPDNIIIREEMLSLANWSDASSGTGFINIGGRAQRNSGSFQINSGATLGGRGVAAFGGSNFWPQQHNPWRAVFCFTLDTLANVRIRVGFSLNPAALWTSRFTGLSYNSSLSPNLRFVNDSGSSPVFTDTGVAASTGSFKLTMRGSTDGQIYISLNDGAETLITGGLTFGVRSIFGIENLATGSARFEADFFSYFGTINR